MCGIVAIFGMTGSYEEVRQRAVRMSKLLRHRGPDWSGVSIFKTEDGRYNILCHERLAIVDPMSGEQPLYGSTPHVCVSINGEIYNHMELKASLSGHQYEGTNDCQVVPHMWEEHKEGLCAKLDGPWAFALYDETENIFMVARDPIGIAPLYYGYGKGGEYLVASEMKAIQSYCCNVRHFPPGHYYTSRTSELVPYYQPKWYEIEYIPNKHVELEQIRTGLIDSVKKRLMSDVPFGLLLSGGLDSSLTASIASRLVKEMHLTEGGTKYPKLHSFCIGLKGSPDLKAAREVADLVGTEHHEFTFTVQQGIDALEDVIYHIESFNVTTVRASTPMYLMSRKIRALGVKMVLSGEGADEVFGGYLYFHKAPNAEEFHKETVRKVKDLNLYDVLRANKSTSAFGVESRVPFLDTQFLDLAMDMDPSQKLITKEHDDIEKYILRKAFDVEEDPYLPKHILWRQKEQFSDGVGYSWVDGLRDHATSVVSDLQMKFAEERFPINTPETKEGYFYRSLFEKHFPNPLAAKTIPQVKSVACSSAAAIEWDKKFQEWQDESGRSVDVHVHNYTGSAGTTYPTSDFQDLFQVISRLFSLPNVVTIAAPRVDDCRAG